MSNDSLALVIPPPSSPSDAEYDSILAAVTETARGSWFLTEYARRNHPSDTESGLAAIQRMEAAIGGERAMQSFDRFRFDVVDMAEAIARAKAEIAATIKSEAERFGKIEDVLDYLEGRIKAAIDIWGEDISRAPISEEKTPESSLTNASSPADVGVDQAAVAVMSEPHDASADEQRDASIEDIGRVMMALEPIFPAEVDENVAVPRSAPIDREAAQLAEAGFTEQELGEYLPAVEMNSTPRLAVKLSQAAVAETPAARAQTDDPSTAVAAPDPEDFLFETAALPEVSMAAPQDETRPIASPDEADPGDFLLGPVPADVAIASFEKLLAQTVEFPQSQMAAQAESMPPAASSPEQVTPAPSPAFPSWPASRPVARPQNDPLAPLRWLSDEARIALFS